MEGNPALSSKTGVGSLSGGVELSHSSFFIPRSPRLMLADYEGSLKLSLAVILHPSSGIDFPNLLHGAFEPWRFHSKRLPCEGPKPMQIPNLFTRFLCSDKKTCTNGPGFTKRRPVVAAAQRIARPATPSSVPSLSGVASRYTRKP